MLTLESLQAMKGLGEFKNEFKSTVKKTELVIMLIDYTELGKKASVALLFKSGRTKDFTDAAKFIKKEKIHKWNKVVCGTLLKDQEKEWTLDVTGGGASLDLATLKGNELFSCVGVTLKVQQGKPDPDMVLDEDEAATPSSDVAPAPNEQADATKKTETPKADTAAKIKNSLDKYSTSLDALDKQITPATMKAIYDKIDMVKDKIVEFRQLLAQETAVDGELMKLLNQVEKKADDLQKKIDALEESAKEDSDVSTFAPAVKKVLERFIAQKNAIEKAMKENPANPKIAAAFQKLKSEYVAVKTEISTLTGTDEVAYEKALNVLNAEKEKLDILERAASEHKEDADNDAELQAELGTILKGKKPQQVFVEWEAQLKTLQADIQQLVKQAQGAK